MEKSMSMESCTISGREYAIWVPEDRGPFSAAVICGGDMREQLPDLAAGRRPRVLISPPSARQKNSTP